MRAALAAAGVLYTAVLLLLIVLLCVARAARALWSLLRFFFEVGLAHIKRAWRRDVAIWATFKRWLRGHIVLQVLAVEPGDVVLVSFQPGVVVDTQALIDARVSIEAVLRAVHARPGSPGNVRVVVGKGLDVSGVRQVLAAMPAAAQQGGAS